MHIKRERTCIVCRQKNLQNQLIRLVKTETGIELGEKKQGRGAYICKNSECLERMQKNKALNKAFKCNFSNHEYEKLRELIIANKEN